MTHHSRLCIAVIDVPPADHDQELEFWQGAVGRPMTSIDEHPEYHGTRISGPEFGLLIQRLDDGAARVHLDFHTDDLAAEVARLERLGASRVQQMQHWWIMRDPAGLPFCVVSDPPGTLSEANAQRWD